MSSSVSTSERDEQFRSMIGDLRERIHEIEIFDGPEQVEEYCTELEIEATHAYESAVAHLGSLHEEMLKEIDEYRAKLLDPSGRDSSEIEEELNALSQEVEEAANNSRIRCFDSEEESSRSIWHDALLQKTRSIKTSLKREAFHAQFLKFNPNHLFSIAKDHIGSFEYLTYDHFARDTIRAKPIKIEEPSLNISTTHTKTLTGLGFIGESSLVTASLDTTAMVLDRETGKELLILDNEFSNSSLVTLDDERFAIGDKVGYVYLWNAKSGEMCLWISSAHDSAVTSLKVLRSGHLASRSLDKTIKIWNVSKWCPDDRNLVTITGCGAQVSWFFMDEFSNGYIIANTAENREDIQELKIWSCKDGKMVKEIDTGLKDLTGLCVLKNDEVAIASFGGDIKIINLADPSLARILAVGNQGKNIQMLKNLHNGYLLEVDMATMPLIRVWDPNLGTVVQTLEVDALGPTWCFDISPCKRFMAIGSKQVVRVWSIDNNSIKVLDHSDNIVLKSS